MEKRFLCVIAWLDVAQFVANLPMDELRHEQDEFRAGAQRGNAISLVSRQL
jgi:hypothetical protein